MMNMRRDKSGNPTIYGSDGPPPDDTRETSDLVDALDALDAAVADSPTRDELISLREEVIEKSEALARKRAE
jgi:hypothetical protein